MKYDEEQIHTKLNDIVKLIFFGVEGGIIDKQREINSFKKLFFFLLLKREREYCGWLIIFIAQKTI